MQLIGPITVTLFTIAQVSKAFTIHPNLRVRDPFSDMQYLQL